MKKKPLIGVMLDWQWGGTFSGRPHYALREHYFEAVTCAGGMPVGLPADKTLLTDYVAMMDGLLLPGGRFPMPSEWFVTPPEKNVGYSPRAEASMLYIHAALRLKKPILGICAGCQELDVAMGGKLHARLSEVNPHLIGHSGYGPEQLVPAHAIKPKMTIMHDIVARAGMATGSHPLTNSDHLGGIATLGKDVSAAGVLEADGTIEAITLQQGLHPWVLGVMWHPEYLLTPFDRAVWDAFVAAC